MFFFFVTDKKDPGTTPSYHTVCPGGTRIVPGSILEFMSQIKFLQPIRVIKPIFRHLLPSLPNKSNSRGLFCSTWYPSKDTFLSWWLSTQLANCGLPASSRCTQHPIPAFYRPHGTDVAYWYVLSSITTGYRLHRRGSGSCIFWEKPYRISGRNLMSGSRSGPEKTFSLKTETNRFQL